MISCVVPFVYNGSLCVCQQNYIFNGQFCINLPQQLDLINTSIVYFNVSINDIELQLDQLTQNIDNINNKVQNIQANNSQLQLLNQTISDKIEANKQFMLNNLAILDQRILNNSTQLYSAIQANVSSLKTQINTSVQSLNASVLNLNQSLINSTSQLNQSIQLTNANLVGNMTLANNSMNALFNQSEMHIQGNISAVNLQQQNNLAILDQRILNNSTQLYSAIQANVSSLKTQINTSVQSLNASVLNLNQSLINSTSQLNQSIQLTNANLVGNMTLANNSMNALFNQSEMHIQGNISAVNLQQQNNLAILDQRILNNSTQLYSAIQANVSSLKTQINTSVQSLNASVLNLNQSLINSTSQLNQSIQLTNANLVGNMTLANNSMNALFNQSEMHIQGNISAVNLQQQNNLAILDQRILNNSTQLYSAIQANVSSLKTQINTSVQSLNASVLNLNQSLINSTSQLNQSIQLTNANLVGNMTLANNSMNALFNQSEMHIQGNISAVNLQQQNNLAILDQRILNNSTQLYSAIQANVSSLKTQINTSVQSLNASVLNLNQSLINSTSQLNQSIQLTNANINQQFILFNQSLTLKDQQITQLVSQLNYIQTIILNTNEQELWFTCQQQLYTFKTFDISTITHNVTGSNTSSQSIFDQQIVQNALINIQSFSSNTTLFNQQNVLLNIKIQLNNIIFDTCVLLSSSDSIQINQMSIISASSTNIFINSGKTLGLIQNITTQSNITNLQVNVQVSSNSQGAISLINTLDGQVDIKGYQILGTYFSKSTIAMGIRNVLKDSSVCFNYIQINPKQFTVGNETSLLISVINGGNIQMSHISITIGNQLEENIFCDTTITTTSTNPMRYGGIITIMNNSVSKIFDLSINMFEKVTTQFINKSGQLLGYVNSSKTQLFMICISENIQSNSNSTFYMFGVIGYHSGGFQLNQLSAEYIMNQGIYNVFGLLGFVNGTSANLINMLVSVQTGQNKGVQAAAVASILGADTQYIQNISVYNSYITAQSLVGLVASCIYQGNVQQINVMSSYICAASLNYSALAGSIFGETVDTIQLQTSIVNNITVASYSTQTWAISGGVIADTHENPTILKQVSVQESVLQASGPVTKAVSASGLIAFLYNATIQISNTHVKNMNMTVDSATNSIFCSGFLASISNTTITITSSKVQTIQINIWGTQQFSGIILSNPGDNKFFPTSVFSEGYNTINGNVILNCPLITNQSQRGC
ncbi:Conserved_hypothetical protein [Hexamita inflata]|uniref:Uncharacterized protein n=1 Tax=Hexamita inflata TaxID=28002 RepID=A0AA86UXK4_9EUKA|nr:Conserved hypothetical protein [Hexamita inflata]